VADKLRGWGQIASYLGFEVRTAQKYEHTRALPVRRLPGGGKAPVFALKSELDSWWELESKGDAIVRGGEKSNVASAGTAELAAQALKRIYASQEEMKLYRQDYVMRFSLRATGSGIRAHIEYRYELCNATEERLPFIQEVTVDDGDHGYVESVSFSLGEQMIYELKNPRISERYVGWVTYRAPRQWIAPRNRYVCRARWVIERGPNDIWYNHMILPTIGFKVETQASAGYEIVGPRPDTGLVMKGEHRDISWRKRTQP
jgi:hypothetical protein